MTLIKIQTASEQKAFNKEVPSRRIFNTKEEAEKALANYSQIAAQYGIPVLNNTEAMADDTYTFVVSQQTKAFTAEDGAKFNSCVALIFTGYPKPEAFLANEDSRKWLDGAVTTAAMQTIFRKLRDAQTEEELTAGLEAAPKTVEEFNTVANSSGVDWGVWHEVYPITRHMLASDERFSALNAALPAKGEILKAIRSKSYAESAFEALEGLGKNGAFMLVANVAIKAAKEEGLDPSVLEQAVAGRDSLHLTPPKTVDYGALGQLADVL